MSVLPRHAPLRAEQRFSRPSPRLMACACAASRSPVVPCAVPGAGSTVIFLRSHWPTAGPGWVRAHSSSPAPALELSPTSAAVEGWRTPFLFFPSTAAVSPLRGNCPEWEGPVAAWAAAAALPFRYVGGGRLSSPHWSGARGRSEDHPRLGMGEAGPPAC